MKPSIDQTLHQFAILLPNWTLLPILTLLPNFGGFHRTLQRVRLANRGRLLLRTPGPVPFGTCICSNVETILSWTCHVYGPFEFRTFLGTSILLWEQKFSMFKIDCNCVGHIIPFELNFLRHYFRITFQSFIILSFAMDHWWGSKPKTPIWSTWLLQLLLYFASIKFWNVESILAGAFFLYQWIISKPTFFTVRCKCITHSLQKM